MSKITFAQESRLHAALGLPAGPVDPEVLVAAAEGQKRALASAVTDTNRRTLAASEGSARELTALRAEVASLRSQNRLAARERELDRRDELEEADYQRDFAFRFGQKARTT